MGSGDVSDASADGEEEVQDEVHAGAEGEDAEVCGGGGVDHPEAGGVSGSAVLSRGWGEEESPQGMDAQQQAQPCQEQ